MLAVAVWLTATLILFLAFSLYVSTTIRKEAFRPTKVVPPFNIEILAVEGNTLTLRPKPGNTSDRWKQEGFWGLRWEGGHAQVGPIVKVGDRQAVREFTPFVGHPMRGVQARFDWATFPDDPQAAFSLTPRQVTFTSPLGKLRAYIIDGRQPVWVLFVHGKRGAAPRRPPYAYPILPLISQMGWTSMEITYRNDVGEPQSPDGRHWYGLTEWEDLEGAARYALREGARSLILVGYSMGGSIVASFLYRSPLAGKVRGVILDAPVLDLEAVVDSGVRRRGVPGFLITPGKWLLRLWDGVDWNALDYLRTADELDVPILLFHGDADPLIPVLTSDRLAALRPDLVTYVRVRDATHGHCWNVARGTYEEAVRRFLLNRV